MAVYTRYARVLDAAGKPLSVRGALARLPQLGAKTVVND